VNKNYKCLSTQLFSNEGYSIVPIRKEDRYEIMKWRNEQIYHLRQDKPLTKEAQDKYFDEVVSSLFDQAQPNQILFSYLKGDKCIGYGGLVHINWLDKNAEISFIMETNLEKIFFEFHWTTFLKLIEKAAFMDIKLHKLFVFAFDLRPNLYTVLEKSNYFKDALLKEHCFVENCYRDVVIHSKINSQ
jgi:RimJ/RimL family protein N-acetyltransferase